MVNNMIVNRIFPLHKDKYLNTKPKATQFGEKIDQLGLIQLFGVWVLTVSGIVLNNGLKDRFTYWEWSDWTIGLVKLFIVSMIFIYGIKKNSLWKIGQKTLSQGELLSVMGIGLLFFYFGNLSFTNFSFELVRGVPYLLLFIGVIHLYQIPIVLNKDIGDWFVSDWSSKISAMLISIGLMSIGVFIGFSLDDPVISTAGMVAIPFPIIALIWPNHVRHIQRARFYPLFIFAMFLCVRAPWFLIPLALLFYFLRTLNYFRYGITYPSFGVNLDDI